MEIMNAIMKETNKTLTENGAIGLKSTGKAVTDFMFKIPSYRNNVVDGVCDFAKICNEKNEYLYKLLFYIRDIRGGLGERKLFRTCLLQALNSTKLSEDEARALIEKIPEFGRWDDLLILLNHVIYGPIAAEVIKAQFAKDLRSMHTNKPVSLLGKWLPSDNASSKANRHYAYKLAKVFDISVKDYRRLVRDLRNYLNVTETKTCANKWGEIDYNAVPSKANLRYKDAFMRHDSERRLAFINSLSDPNSGNKINAAVNFPYEIAYNYHKSQDNFYCYGDNKLKEDTVYETMWKGLSDIPGLDNSLVIRDGSGSMESGISGTNVRALDVADALSIYCSEHCSGAFKDQFITFSSEPEVVSLKNCTSLCDKLNVLGEYDDCSNTDMEATFDLILNAAVSNNLTQADLPEQLIIVSDMEFDECHYEEGHKDTKTLFEVINQKFENAGFKLPKLVFWNVNSRTNTIPMTENEEGVVLISGFSQNAINIAFSESRDPYQAIIDALNSDRYKDIPLAVY